MNNSLSTNKSKLGWQNQVLLTLKKEEKLIKQLHLTSGKSWRQISEILNKRSSGKIRNAKQCRQRYTNFIKFKDLSQPAQNWGFLQDKELLITYQRLGSKWAQIAGNFFGRSSNEIKNKFYGLVRRFLRKINSFKRSKHSDKKQITYCSLYRLLQSNQSLEQKQYDILDQKQKFIKQLKTQVLNLLSNIQNMSLAQALQIGQKIKRFNVLTRSDRIKALKIPKTRKSKDIDKHQIVLQKQSQACTLKDMNQIQPIQIDPLFQQWNETKQFLQNQCKKHQNIEKQKNTEWAQQINQLNFGQSFCYIQADLSAAQLFNMKSQHNILDFLDYK